MRRGSLRERLLRQLGERLDVYRPLEMNDLPHRLPPGRPAPLVELRLGGSQEIERHLGPLQAQEEPALFLADAHRLLLAADIPRGQSISQPAARLPNELDVHLGQPDLLVQLPVESLLER